MHPHSLKRSTDLLIIVIALVLLASTVCLCASTKSMKAFAASKLTVQKQIEAAKKAANQGDISYTDAEKAHYRKALTENLKKMNLQQDSTDNVLLAIQRFLVGIADWIHGLFKNAPRVGGLGELALTILEWAFKIAAYLFVFAATVALLYVLFLLIRNAWRTNNSQAKISITAVVEPDVPKIGPVDELLTTADLLYQQDNYREALRHLYLASISLLTRAQIVTYSKDKTNRDYLRTLAKTQNPPALDSFRGITDIFDSVVYGGHKAADTDYVTAREYAVGLGESL